MVQTERRLRAVRLCGVCGAASVIPSVRFTEIWVRAVPVVLLVILPLSRLVAPVDSIAAPGEDRPSDFEPAKPATGTAFTRAGGTPPARLVFFFDVPVSKLGRGVDVWVSHKMKANQSLLVTPGS